MNEPGPVQSKRLIRKYIELGRLMEAMVVAKRAIALFAPGYDFRVLLSEVYAADGKAEQAMKELAEVLCASPDHVEAKRLLRRLRDS